METIYKDTKQRTLLPVLLHERQYKVNSGIYHKLIQKCKNMTGKNFFCHIFFMFLIAEISYLRG